MPGVRNPFQRLVGHVRRSTEQFAGMSQPEAETSRRRTTEEFLERPNLAARGYIDVTIHFIGASGLPKMDVIGTADPYFVAKLDSALTYVSSVKPNTLAPVWNEYWKIRNVPPTAKLYVDVIDKDDGTVTDDFIGRTETNISNGAKELTLEGDGVLRKISRGTIWIKIDVVPATDPKAPTRQYIFDGPIRYSRHFSPTVGLLTNLQDTHLYSTWKMFLRGVPLFFGDRVQHWNRNYKSAQTIFQGTTSVAVRSTIQAGHRMLYARTSNNSFGVINGGKDVVQILHGGKPGSGTAHRVKPAVYTYIISADDDSFRFSETGAAFFVDFASKHALHSNCATVVRYSGEFHPRPEGGWENFNDDVPDDQVQWELVLDNNSGTYAPDPMMLADLKDLFEYNFPEFKIQTFDFNDPRLAQSRDACRAYALAKRGVAQDELQPNPHVPGEVTLSHSVTAHVHPGHPGQSNPPPPPPFSMPTPPPSTTAPLPAETISFPIAPMSAYYYEPDQ